MNEDLDKTLTELRNNIDQFKKMVETFGQADKRLSHIESEIGIFQKSFDEIKEKQDALSREQVTLTEDLRRENGELKQNIESFHQTEIRLNNIETEIRGFKLSLDEIKNTQGVLNQDKVPTKEDLLRIESKFDQIQKNQGFWMIILALFVMFSLIGLVVLAICI